MSKTLIAALATAATMLSAGAAHANNVQWSIGINLPPVGTVISNGPVYAPAPIYAPAPVYYPAPVYEPAPVVYGPPQVIYRPVPRVVYPSPVIIGRPVPVGYGHGWGDRDHDGVPNRWDRYDNRYDNRGGHWDRDHDGIPDRHDRRDDRRDDRKYRH